MAALPNATYIGFTGTPIDKTAHGQGTFKTFGVDDAPDGYLDKYSIKESIEDGTTLPLFYALAPNELRVPSETMDKEFFALADTEGIADIEELNKILDRAVNLKNFLKGKERIQKVAKYVAQHYQENIEPLGYKAFLLPWIGRPALFTRRLWMNICHLSTRKSFTPEATTIQRYSRNSTSRAEGEGYTP